MHVRSKAEIWMVDWFLKGCGSKIMCFDRLLESLGPPSQEIQGWSPVSRDSSPCRSVKNPTQPIFNSIEVGHPLAYQTPQNAPNLPPKSTPPFHAPSLHALNARVRASACGGDLPRRCLLATGEAQALQLAALAWPSGPGAFAPR